ncbi:PHB depolymerase family esterase [Acidovorax sp. Be4]|uniref:PHB depolymerase family esterase n=1 Tax=Acidovorax bellezanensis TaxID=2976702 RepID=A0ABT2PSQ0_9BURK|nr:PHB depolymerase family esterase [Acidovorax sp. Be4]MCT9812138.1 PHB depolymerase family esterase [Acidovorax sp. Be4]
MKYLLRQAWVQAGKWVRKIQRQAKKPAKSRAPKLRQPTDAPAGPPNPPSRLAPSGAALAKGLPRNSATAPARHAEQWIDGKFTHRGRTLAYKLYLPPKKTSEALRPMVVMLHGCRQDAADFAAGTRMNAQARASGVVALYPEQSRRGNLQKCWNWFNPLHQQRGRGEPAVLVALTLSIAASHQVDMSRIFVAGLSAGGAMANILGIGYPEVFAAIGVHSGLPKGCATDWVSALTVMRMGCLLPAATPAAGPFPPTIVFHGDADNTVHINNGIAVITAALAARGAQSAEARWVEGQSAQGQGYSQTIYQDSAGRTLAEFWQLHGAGHAWSGGHPDASYTNPAGVDATAQMLRFFLENPMSCAIPVPEQEQPAAHVS